MQKSFPLVFFCVVAVRFNTFKGIAGWSREALNGKYYYEALWQAQNTNLEPKRMFLPKATNVGSFALEMANINWCRSSSPSFVHTTSPWIKYECHLAMIRQFCWCTLTGCLCDDMYCSINIPLLQLTFSERHWCKSNDIKLSVLLIKSHVLFHRFGHLFYQLCSNCTCQSC